MFYLSADFLVSPSLPAAGHTVGIIDQESLLVISVYHHKMSPGGEISRLHGTYDNLTLVQCILQSLFRRLGLVHTHPVHRRHIFQQLPCRTRAGHIIPVFHTVFRNHIRCNVFVSQKIIQHHGQAGRAAARQADVAPIPVFHITPSGIPLQEKRILLLLLCLCKAPSRGPCIRSQKMIHKIRHFRIICQGIQHVFRISGTVPVDFRYDLIVLRQLFQTLLNLVRRSVHRLVHERKTAEAHIIHLILLRFLGIGVGCRLIFRIDHLVGFPAGHKIRFPILYDACLLLVYRQCAQHLIQRLVHVLHLNLCLHCKQNIHHQQNTYKKQIYFKPLSPRIFFPCPLRHISPPAFSLVSSAVPHAFFLQVLKLNFIAAFPRPVRIAAVFHPAFQDYRSHVTDFLHKCIILVNYCKRFKEI